MTGRHVEPAGPLPVRVLRGDDVESVHLVHFCLVDLDGGVLARSGPDAVPLPVFLRSAAKPLQALPAVETGALGRLGLDARHVAVACASHGGSDGHVAVVREILDAVSLPEGVLRCGVVPPLDPAVARALAARGEAPSPIRHNCSGNHALALALSVDRGWPTGTYLEPDHPVQRTMREVVARAAAGVARPLREAADGCGMRAYSLTLPALAAAYARLAGRGLGAAGDEVAAAMRAHPELVQSAGGLDTEIMRAAPALVAKIGAEGVLAVGHRDGRGLALKVADGGLRALAPAALHLLEGLLDVPATAAPLAALREPSVLDARGEVVGRIVA